MDSLVRLTHGAVRRTRRSSRLSPNPRPKSHAVPLKGDSEGFKVKNYVRILDGNLGPTESFFLNFSGDRF